MASLAAEGSGGGGGGGGGTAPTPIPTPAIDVPNTPVASLAAEEELSNPSGSPTRPNMVGDGQEFMPHPLNNLVSPMLTDMYQLTMTYAYWHAGRHEEHAVFELFFRKNPFEGEFTIFVGLDQVLAHLKNFHFTTSDIDYIRQLLPNAKPEFFDYLAAMDCSKVVVSAVKDGTIVFPRTVLLKVEGPLAVGQLLETTLLNLVNYPSLICTNAARMRLAAQPKNDPEKKVILLEFGLRRAQGPDGGISASRYAVAGGFDGTSNVLAGKLTGIMVSGTHAHAFVQSYTGFHMIQDPMLNGVDLLAQVQELRTTKPMWMETNSSELAAFIAYALCFPDNFLALVDTYDTLNSGVFNYIMVARCLIRLGYSPKGIRLDSGDLAYLSKECRRRIDEAATDFDEPELAKSIIVASNDIHEEVLLSLNNQGHCIDAFGIGTHLVTCKAQPALGCVYKLVEINGSPRIKLSQEIGKVVIPGKKKIYRLLNAEGCPLIDLIQRESEPPPKIGERVLCRHPFQENKRCLVTPTAVVELLEVVFDGPNGYCAKIATAEEMREKSSSQLKTFREDIIRPLNPTPYKVAVSQALYSFLHDLWLQNMPIPELT